MAERDRGRRRDRRRRANRWARPDRTLGPPRSDGPADDPVSSAEARAFDEVIDIRLRTGQWPVGVAGLDARGDLAGLAEGLLWLSFDEWPADAGPVILAADVQAFDEVIDIRLRTGQWPVGVAGLDDRGDLAGLVEGLLSLRIEEWPDTAHDAAQALAGARAFDEVLEVRLRTGEWPLVTSGLDDRGDLAGLVEGILSLRAVEWPEDETAGFETAAARAVDDILELRLRTGEWPFVLADFDQDGELSGVVEGLLSLEPGEWPEESRAPRPRPLGVPTSVSPVPASARVSGPTGAGAPVVRIRLGAGRPAGGRPVRLLAVAAGIVVLAGAVSVVSLTTSPSRPASSAAPVRARMALVDDQVLLTPVATVSTGSAPSAVAVNSVTCVSAATCLAVGQNTSGAVTATSNNGGATWRVVAAPAGITRLSDVVCPTAGECWAVGTAGRTAGIVSSTDGGFSWSSVAPPGGVTSLVSLDCPSATTCRAAGQGPGGPAVIGTDNGATWMAEVGPTVGGNLTSISCPEPTDCAVGSGGPRGSAVMSTGDGGQTWSSEPLTGITAGTASTGPNGTPAAAVNTVTGVQCPTTTFCSALGFDAAGSAWILLNDGPSSAWKTSNFPLSTVAAGDRAYAFLPCQGATCPASVGETNTALAIIEEQPGLSGSGPGPGPGSGAGSGSVYACRGATSQCWVAGLSGDGFTATVIGSPVPVEAHLTD